MRGKGDAVPIFKRPWSQPMPPKTHALTKAHAPIGRVSVEPVSFGNSISNRASRAQRPVAGAEARQCMGQGGTVT